MFTQNIYLNVLIFNTTIHEYDDLSYISLIHFGDGYIYRNEEEINSHLNFFLGKIKIILINLFLPNIQSPSSRAVPCCGTLS